MYFNLFDFVYFLHDNKIRQGNIIGISLTYFYGAVSLEVRKTLADKLGDSKEIYAVMYEEHLVNSYINDTKFVDLYNNSLLSNIVFLPSNQIFKTKEELLKSIGAWDKIILKLVLN